MTSLEFPPKFMYGTAWKEDRTRVLTSLAIDAGFRAFDTANQRKHYFEAGMGEAIHAAIQSGTASGPVTREDFFIQTKFTYQRGQDHRLPYDPSAPFKTQVEQSFTSSLDHLKTDYLDSYVLHGPEYTRGITDGDQEVWRAMESLHQRKLTRHLGLSNVSLDQLKLFFNYASIKPTFVQNRCFADTKWDKAIRQFCNEHGLTYQGFSLLTANPQAVGSNLVSKLADKYSTGAAQIIFRFAQQVGMCPLTGTSRAQNMKDDLACDQFTMTSDELAAIERVAG